MSEEKTEKTISKEHAEQIWQAVLKMTESQKGDSLNAAKDLVETRQMLDKAIEQMQLDKKIQDLNERVKRELKLCLATQKMLSLLRESRKTEEKSRSEIGAAEKADSAVDEKFERLVPKETFEGFMKNPFDQKKDQRVHQNCPSAADPLLTLSFALRGTYQNLDQDQRREACKAQLSAFQQEASYLLNKLLSARESLNLV